MTYPLGDGAPASAIRFPTPRSDSLGLPVGLTAGKDGREFIAAYDDAGSRGSDTELFSFRLTAAGRITGFRLVRGGILKNVGADFVVGTGLAVSPDGSKVAMAVQCQSRGCSSRIVVIDLSTGARTSWSGGLPRLGFFSDIPSISWAGNDLLVFLTRWCPNPDQYGFCGSGPHDAQVRTLDLTTGGGSLAQGKVLLRESARYPDITQAQLGGDGAIVIEVARGNRHGVPAAFQVVNVPLTGTGQPRLL